MRIGIEANTYYKNTAGSGVYARNIIDTWTNGLGADNILLFTNKRLSEIDLAKKNNLLNRIFNGIFDVFWMQFVLPIQLLTKKADVLFCPAFLAPVFSPVPTAVSIFDMSFIRFPESCEYMFRKYLSFFMPLIKYRADSIITISLFSKKEIIELLHVPENKVRVVYLGYKSIFRQIEQSDKIDSIRNKYTGGNKFILYVGTIEPRKNIPAIIKAFSCIREKGHINHKFVICGSKGWYYQSIIELIIKLKLQDDVILTGYVDENELPLIYNAADLFVFPSFYEGFGLPVLEAMACGCPVIASNTSSLPEVVGDAGILINPENFEEISDAIVKIIEKPEFRRELVLKGLERAKQFSWEKASKEILDGLYGIQQTRE